MTILLKLCKRKERDFVLWMTHRVLLMKQTKPFMKQNKTTQQTTQQTTHNNNDTTDDTTGDTNDPHRALREGITVVTENGEKVNGYVVHWVRNYNYETPGTDIQNWFIFQPGTYPTHYIIKKPKHPNSEIVITDL